MKNIDTSSKRGELSNLNESSFEINLAEHSKIYSEIPVNKELKSDHDKKLLN